MPKAIKICRVCGKEYEYCKTWLDTYKFRWQDVACSPECGSEYFALIEASRAPQTQETPSTAEEVAIEEPVHVTEAPKKMTKRGARKSSEVAKDANPDETE